VKSCHQFLGSIVLLASFAVGASAQVGGQATPSKEIFIRTKNTGGATITFRTRAVSTIVWDQQNYITTNQEFTNPADLEIEGDIASCESGWDRDGSASPRLGRATYEIIVVGKSAKLTVYTTGTTFLGDKLITYDANADEFLGFGISCSDLSGDPIQSFVLSDNPAGLQPTPPRNLTVTDENNHPKLS
jgi:hypothetical protein